MDDLTRQAIGQRHVRLPRTLVGPQADQLGARAQFERQCAGGLRDARAGGSQDARPPKVLERVEFEWSDDETRPPGLSWYYVRAIQDDGQLAWASPIWVQSSATVAQP